MAEKELSDEQVVEALLEIRKQPGHDQLRSLVREIRAAGGSVVAWDDGDDWCPPFKLPWPPKPKAWELVQSLLQHHRRIEVFPIGIPVPEELLITVRNRGYGR